MTTSTLRTLIEQAFTTRNTTLEEFVASGRADGKTMRELAHDVHWVTGIPVSYRSLYRWVR